MKYDWVAKFRRVSWEPEMLISGGLLFTLLQFDKILFLLDNYFYALQAPLDPILGTIAIAISSLTVGFCLHLILKAFWIAMLGLKSVYPKGIAKDKLNYSIKYLRQKKSYLSLDSSIKKIGDTSSLLFTISILMLFVILGIAVYTTIILIITLNIATVIPFGYAFFIPIFPAFIDFITLGYFKKAGWIARIYYPYYKLISTITLSFLYKDILYVIISNISKRKIFVFLLLISIPIAFLTRRNITTFTNRDVWIRGFDFTESLTQSEVIQRRDYENLRSIDGQIEYGTIHSDVVSGNHIKIYLRYKDWWDGHLANLANEAPTLSHSEIINQFLVVKIDQETFDNIPWFVTRREEINQQGIIGYISIPELSQGAHIITVSWAEGRTFFTAPFFKE